MSAELRLELLKITRPNVDSPDLETWLKRARALEAYVCGAGQPEQSVQQNAADLSQKVRTTRNRAPAPA